MVRLGSNEHEKDPAEKNHNHSSCSENATRRPTTNMAMFLSVFFTPLKLLFFHCHHLNYGSKRKETAAVNNKRLCVNEPDKSSVFEAERTCCCQHFDLFLLICNWPEKFFSSVNANQPPTLHRNLVSGELTCAPFFHNSWLTFEMTAC